MLFTDLNLTKERNFRTGSWPKGRSFSLIKIFTILPDLRAFSTQFQTVKLLTGYKQSYEQFLDPDN